MSDLVELEQQLLAHNLERTHFSGILLLGKENLTVTTLADLRKNLEVALTQPSSSLAEICSLTAEILIKGFIVLSFGRRRRRRILCFELVEPVLPRVHIGEKVVVVIQEICFVSSVILEYNCARTKLSYIRETLDLRLPCLLQFLGGESLEPWIVAG